MCSRILAAVLKCGEFDINFLEEKVRNWDIDIDDAVEVAENYNGVLDINVLLYEVFKRHSQDVKGWIVNLLFNNDVEFDEEKLEGYETEIYVNYYDTSYDDKYSFWYMDTEDELQDNIEEIAEFLINEGIVEGETKTTLLDKISMYKSNK